MLGRQLNWVEWSILSVRYALGGRWHRPSPKTKLLFVIEVFLNTKISRRTRQEKLMLVNFAWRKLKRRKTSYWAPANVQDHVGLFIYSVSRNGFIWRLKKRLLGGLNSLITRNSSARFARLNSPWSLRKKAKIWSYCHWRNLLETIWFSKQPVRKPRVSCSLLI